MRSSLAVLLLLISLLLSGTARGAPGPGEVVKGFYSWYLSDPRANLDWEGMRTWVDDRLVDELILAEERGWEDGDFLDFDPFLASQTSFKSFHVEAVKLQGDQALATVALRGGTGEGAPPVQVTLRRRDGRWRMTSVDRPGLGGPGLLAVLDEINRDFRPGARPKGVSALSYGADGRLAVGTENGQILVFREEKLLRRYELPHPRRVMDLGFLPGGNVWIRDTRFVRALDLQTGTVRQGNFPHGTPTVVSPDGARAATLTSRDRRDAGQAIGVAIVDLKSAQEEAWLAFGDVTEGSLDFSPDSRWLAAAQKGSLLVWDVGTRARAARLAGVDFRFLKFLPGGTLLSLDSAGALVEWEIPSGKQLHVGYAGLFRPTGWDVSAEGTRVLMAGEEGRSVVWSDRATRNPDVTLAGAALRFLPPDNRLLVRRGEDLVILDPSAQTTLATRTGVGPALAVRPDGKQVAWANLQASAADGSDLVEVWTLP